MSFNFTMAGGLDADVARPELENGGRVNDTHHDVPHDLLNIMTSNYTDLTVDQVPDDDSGGSQMVGIAVGVSVACILVIVIIALIIFLIVRRNKRKHRDKSIVKVENPQYKLNNDSLTRRATLEKTSLSTAPTVNFQVSNNLVTTSAHDSSTGGQSRRGKGSGDTAVQPIYRPTKVMTVAGKVSKKSVPPPAPPSSSDKAPPPRPPPPVVLSVQPTTDLYEKDSAHGSMDNIETPSDLQSIDNPHSHPSLSPHALASSPPLPTHHKPPAPRAPTPVNRPESTDSEESSNQRAPLLSDTSSTNQRAPLLLDTSYRQAPPKPARISVSPTPPLAPSPHPSAQGGRVVGGSEDEGMMEGEEEGEGVGAALLGGADKNKNNKMVGSNVSLDSYDRELNPFFADS